MTPWIIALLVVFSICACFSLFYDDVFIGRLTIVVGLALIVCMTVGALSGPTDTTSNLVSESRSDYAAAQSAYKDYKKLWDEAIKSPDPAIKRFAENHRPNATSVKLPSKPAHIDRKILSRELNAEKRATKANKENMKILKQLLAVVATGQPKVRTGTTSA